ncbi:arabinosyltransferase domain-containing protein, partial [Nocardia cyriacigeorgica]
LTGPNLAWYEDYLRYYYLFVETVDGSVSRRFAFLVMLLCLLVCVLQVLRKGRIPGTSRGPSVRILGIVFASLLL